MNFVILRETCQTFAKMEIVVLGHNKKLALSNMMASTTFTTNNERLEIITMEKKGTLFFG